MRPSQLYQYSTNFFSCATFPNRMDAIAEGVETTQQLSQLQALKWEYGQGYFVS